MREIVVVLGSLQQKHITKKFFPRFVLVGWLVGMIQVFNRIQHCIQRTHDKWFFTKMKQLKYYPSDVVDVFELVLFVKLNNSHTHQYECYGILVFG